MPTITKQQLIDLVENTNELAGRVRVLEGHAEQQTAFNRFLLDHMQRLVREKEVLLMHVGLNAMARDNPSRLTPAERIIAIRADRIIREAAANARRIFDERR